MNTNLIEIHRQIISYKREGKITLFAYVKGEYLDIELIFIILSRENFVLGHDRGRL